VAEVVADELYELLGRPLNELECIGLEQFARLRRAEDARHFGPDLARAMNSCTDFTGKEAGTFRLFTLVLLLHYALVGKFVSPFRRGFT
jgi:hypothetical protein